MEQKINLDRQIIESIIAAFNCTSKDATRYRLNNVLLDVDKTSFKIIATDGYKLSCVEYTVVTDITTKYIVTQEQLPLLKLLLKNFKKAKSFEVTISDESLVINYDFKIEIKNQVAHSISYPDYTVFGRMVNRPNTLTVGIDVEHLYNLMLTLKETKATTIKLEFSGPQDVIKVTALDADNKSNYGLLMPCKIKE